MLILFQAEAKSEPAPEPEPEPVNPPTSESDLGRS